MTVQPNSYRGFKVTLGDATGAQLAILVPDTYRVLHLASGADFDTDWNVANPTHPTWYIHSETTPATDYIAFAHDGTDGTMNVAGGDLKLAISGTDELVLTATALSPATSDGNALGTTALMWADLFLASGGVLNFNNGDVTLTHAANVLTLAGGDLALGANNLTMTGTISATGARVTQSYHTNITSTNAVTVDSSETIKHDIKPYKGDALSIINGIDVITFKHDAWIDISERTKMGLRAESVREPLAIQSIEHPEGHGSYPGVNMYGLETLLTRAVQQLSAKIAALEQVRGS